MIIPGREYGDIRKQAAEENPHGLTPNTIEVLRDRFENFLPNLSETHGVASKQFFDGILPKGAELAPIQKNANLPSGVTFPGYAGTGGGGNTMITPQRPYQPEFESPDRQQYPVHRILANRYWRLFYKLDPVIGNCIDMYSTMPFSDFQLSGRGVTGDIKDTLETMCSVTNVLRTLEFMVKEYLVIGECVPHNFFDDTLGIWTYTALHNPDQLEVIDAPFIKMDPIVEFIPDDRLRTVLTSNNHLLRQIREQMPPELISRLVARQNIPLSPVNMTFIPRKMHPYDTRGTSIISRMWRILMYEDAIYNASIATARRHAGPIKVAKLGNPQTGWIPSQEHEKRLLQLLAQAELDVNAWLVYHYGINFEMVGTTDRIMNISQHHEVIERIKLIAIGISKSFLHGEVTYASSVTGLSVFLQRMKSLRNFFVNTWLLPKFFKPIAKINGWVRPDKKEVNSRYRIKRSQKEIEQENRWIVPKIEWEKELDSTVNSDLVNAISSLEQLGIKFSKTTKYSTVGRKFEEEVNKIKEEKKYEEELNNYLPAQELQQGIGAPAGGLPSGPKPGGMKPSGPKPTGVPGAPEPPPGSMPKPEGGGNIPNAPGGGAEAASGDKTGDGGGTGPSGKKDPAVNHTKSIIWDDKGRYGNWSASEIDELNKLIRTGHTDSPLWGDLDTQQFRAAINAGDTWELIDIIEDHLSTEGYPLEDIRQLKKILDAEGIFNDISNGEVDKLKMIENKIDDTLSMMDDEDAMNKLSSQIDDGIVKLTDPEALLIGVGNYDNQWSGDISGMLDGED